MKRNSLDLEVVVFSFSDSTTFEMNFFIPVVRFVHSIQICHDQEIRQLEKRKMIFRKLFHGCPKDTIGGVIQISQT